MPGEDEVRTTKPTEEQKEIKERPRKGSDRTLVHVYSAYEEYIATPEAFGHKMYPFDCELTEAVLTISELVPEQVTLSVILHDNGMTNRYTFEVKKGLTEIDRVIKIFKGTTVKIRLDHPAGFEAKDVYFSASIYKR